MMRGRMFISPVTSGRRLFRRFMHCYDDFNFGTSMPVAEQVARHEWRNAIGRAFFAAAFQKQ